MGRLFLAAWLALIQAATAGTGRVSGVVVEEGSGAPIAGARVTLTTPFRPGQGPLPTRPREATTDDAGRFAFEALEAGGYGVAVMKPPYAPSLSNALVASISIGPGEARDNIRLTLQRGGAIAGRVVDSAGEPIVEARVTAVRAAVNGTTPMLMPAGQFAQTNDLGEFRVYGLPAGEYYILASQRPEGPFGSDPSQTSAFAPTYYPSVPDPQAARPITVVAGQTSPSVVVTLRRVAVFKVSGVAVDESGAPVLNAMVSLLPATMGSGPMTGPPRSARTDAGGRFEVGGVLPGQYYATASIQPAIAGFDAGSVVGSGGVGAVSSSFVFAAGSGTTTETRNGVTVQYRTPNNERVAVSVSDADVVDLRLVANRPQIISPPAAPR